MSYTPCYTRSCSLASKEFSVVLGTRPSPHNKLAISTDSFITSDILPRRPFPQNTVLPGVASPSYTSRTPPAARPRAASDTLLHFIQSRLSNPYVNLTLECIHVSPLHLIDPVFNPKLLFLALRATWQTASFFPGSYYHALTRFLSKV